MVRNLYLAQVNYQYGNNTFLPYSVGRLWAHAKQSPEIVAAYELKEFLFLREDPIKLVNRLINPDVLGLSCYIWNWEWNMRLAQLVRFRYPKCLIVIGGPQVPNKAESFMRSQHPLTTDICVHGEGEEAFTAVLKARISSNQYDPIPGLTLITGRTGENCRSATPGDLASPYLTGVFDKLMALPYDWHASQETNRGCCFSCTFCDWGSATFSKVREMRLDTIRREIDWFSKNKIDLLYNCDANFGMLKQDEVITDMLVEAKAKTGFPNKFRAAYSKKTTDRVYNIAKKLNDAGMSKGVTLSFQSLNKETLDKVKRRNITNEVFGGLMEQYAKDGISTYSEIILGLPGETYDTFVDGICKLMELGQHEGINVYPCITLSNSEMADPVYRKLNKLKTVRTPIMLLHGTPVSNQITEYYDLIIETSTMSHEEWLNAFCFAWAVQTFHCLGLLRLVAIEANATGFIYRRFYEHLIYLAASDVNSVIGREFAKFRALLQSALTGDKWDIVIPGCGSITWPPEEAAFLGIVQRLDIFYWELDAEKWPGDLLARQKAAVIKPSDYDGTLEEYAREVVWYGRKGGKKLKEKRA